MLDQGLSVRCTTVTNISGDGNKFFEDNERVSRGPRRLQRPFRTLHELLVVLDFLMQGATTCLVRKFPFLFVFLFYSLGLPILALVGRGRCGSIEKPVAFPFSLQAHCH